MDGGWGWCPWGSGLPGAPVQSKGEQPPHSPKAGEGRREAIADPPSGLGIPCRISRPSQEMAGQPYKSTCRGSRESRHRHRHRGSSEMPPRWLRVAEPCPLPSPRPCRGPLGLGGHLSHRARPGAATRDATASKPVTQPRRVIPGLLIIDLEWEETGSGLAGQTRM